MAPALNPNWLSTVGHTSCGSLARSVQDFLSFTLRDTHVWVLGQAGLSAVSVLPTPVLKVPRES